MFDPEPYLDDTAQYMKYSSEELVEIITKYDSDFEKYEATKKSFKNEQVVNQSNSIDNEINNTNNDEESQCQHTSQKNNEEKPSTNGSFLENNVSNDSNCENDSKINKNTCQIPRFTDIYDLFQIPKFSLLNSTQHNTTDDHSADDQLEDEESDVPTMVCEKDSEEEYCDEEELFCTDDEEWTEESEEVESSEVEEVVWSDESDELKNINYGEDIKHNSSNGCIENENGNYDKWGNKHANKCNDKPVKIAISNNNVQENDTPQRVVNEIINEDQQLVDYDVLSDWYQKWKQQMNIIQTCVRMSK